MSYCTIVMSNCTIVWQKCHSGTTLISDITIGRHNSNTMPQTVEQGILINYLGESSNICIIDKCAWTINIWHIIKQILTYDVGQYVFYGSLTTILTSASPQWILLHQIHKTSYCPHQKETLTKQLNILLKPCIKINHYSSTLQMLPCKSLIVLTQITLYWHPSLHAKVQGISNNSNW